MLGHYKDYIRMHDDVLVHHGVGNLVIGQGTQDTASVQPVIGFHWKQEASSTDTRCRSAHFQEGCSFDDMIASCLGLGSGMSDMRQHSTTLCCMHTHGWSPPLKQGFCQ